eukprot:10563980-Ditylum_brightwellii.AAC.1
MEPLTKIGKDGYIWRFTPIPDSLQVTNGGEGKCMWDSVTSFSNPKAKDEFVSSFGNQHFCDWGADSHAPYDWHVFDKVIIPTDLEEGEYVLSWRWDAYMADQMWTNCADVTITAASNPSTILNDGDECPSSPPVLLPPTPSPQVTPAPFPQPTPSPVTSSPTVAPMPTSTLNCPAGHSGYLSYDECTKYFYCQNGQ